MTYNITRYLRPSIIFFLILCSSSLFSHAQSSLKDSLPDYNNLNNWAAHPYKHDLSDSVPRPLRKKYHPDSTVDIFFIHPTSYLDETLPFGWNAPLDDEGINKATDIGSIFKQASIFNEAGRIFAPRYRQANYQAYVTKDTLQALAAFDKAYTDIKTAFQFYLAHFNNGRPIVIASHSQGSTHAKRLLKEFFDGKPLSKKLVVAYVVGIPVDPAIYTSLKACETPNATGCICSWRTLHEGFETEFVKKEKYTAIVTNPLSWSNTITNVDRFQNTGAVLYNFNKIIPNVVGAANHGGVLWTAKPHFFGSFLYRREDYHIVDYNFYYLSVRKNVAERVNSFLSANSSSTH